MAENPLANGPVGRGLIAYFAPLGKTPVDAKRLPFAGSGGEVDYELTFEDGTVESYCVTFSPDMRFDVLDVDPLD